MECYEKIVKSLSEVKSLSSHMTALGKVRASTEDQKLIDAIDHAVRKLQSIYSRATPKATPMSLDNLDIKEVNSLLSGCKKIVATKKPEWQILAERNGWSPKT